jgi:hypothetical protein
MSDINPKDVQELTDIFFESIQDEDLVRAVAKRVLETLEERQWAKSRAALRAASAKALAKLEPYNNGKVQLWVKPRTDRMEDIYVFWSSRKYKKNRWRATIELDHMNPNDFDGYILYSEGKDYNSLTIVASNIDR